MNNRKWLDELLISRLKYKDGVDVEPTVLTTLMDLFKSGMSKYSNTAKYTNDLRKGDVDFTKPENRHMYNMTHTWRASPIWSKDTILNNKTYGITDIPEWQRDKEAHNNYIKTLQEKSKESNKNTPLIP